MVCHWDQDLFFYELELELSFFKLQMLQAIFHVSKKKNNVQFNSMENQTCS